MAIDNYTVWRDTDPLLTEIPAAQQKRNPLFAHPDEIPDPRARIGLSGTAPFLEQHSRDQGDDGWLERGEFDDEGHIMAQSDGPDKPNIDTGSLVANCARGGRKMKFRQFM